MKTKGRLPRLLLAICLAAGFMPQIALAAGTDTGKAIQLVDNGTAENISGGQADSVYFGTYLQSSNGNGGYNPDPIKWRVLKNADGKLFLLSDQNLDVFRYYEDYESVTWEKSTIRSWLNGYDASKNEGGDSGIDYSGDSDNFLETAFSAKEQDAIEDTEVVNKDNPKYSTEGGNNTTDKIFLLSIEEAKNGSYFPNGDSSRIATNTAYVVGGGKIGSGSMSAAGEADYWWLRSPGLCAYDAAYVSYYGGVLGSGDFVDYADNAVRPALHFNLDSVLFTSAAAGGKSANGMDTGLAAVEDYSGTEWRLTLKDSHDFSTNASVSGPTDLTVGYSDTTLTITHAALSSFTGADYTNVTAMLTDAGGAVLYYGSINNSTSATRSRVTIPAGLPEGTYTLSVYGEDWNGEKQTDYATGTPITMPISVTAAAKPTTIRKVAMRN